jgi:SRSO17 transposase
MRAQEKKANKKLKRNGYADLRRLILGRIRRHNWRAYRGEAQFDRDVLGHTARALSAVSKLVRAQLQDSRIPVFRSHLAQTTSPAPISVSLTCPAALNMSWHAKPGCVEHHRGALEHMVNARQALPPAGPMKMGN